MNEDLIIVLETNARPQDVKVIEAYKNRRESIIVIDHPGHPGMKVYFQVTDWAGVYASPRDAVLGNARIYRASERDRLIAESLAVTDKRAKLLAKFQREPEGAPGGAWRYENE